MNCNKNIAPIIDVGLIELGCQIVKIKNKKRVVVFFTACY
jgi:hypothetical protein